MGKKKGSVEAVLRERVEELTVKNKHHRTEIEELRQKVDERERIIVVQRRRLNKLEKIHGRPTW